MMCAIRYDEVDDQLMKLGQLDMHEADFRREETRRKLEEGVIFSSAMCTFAYSLII
jgi:hypothetical protein